MPTLTLRLWDDFLNGEQAGIGKFSFVQNAMTAGGSLHKNIQLALIEEPNFLEFSY